jgi:autotransporter passenger strand-loop-strand repeat protein
LNFFGGREVRPSQRPRERWTAEGRFCALATIRGDADVDFHHAGRYHAAGSGDHFVHAK